MLGTQTAGISASELGLVDEVHVHIAPILLGDGIRLHDVAGGHRIDLELVNTARSGEVVSLHYRVIKR